MDHPFFEHFQPANDKAVLSYEYDRWFDSIAALDAHEAQCPSKIADREYREQQREEARARRPLNRIWRAIQSIRRG